jgi:hypothetical protein
MFVFACATFLSAMDTFFKEIMMCTPSTGCHVKAYLRILSIDFCTVQKRRVTVGSTASRS